MPCIIPSPAKLNLFLNVTEQRSDGFHNLTSVFIRLPALSDTLLISPGMSSGLTLTCTNPALAFDSNILHKAYQAFYTWFPQLKPLPLLVHLVKRIPLQAGMGGGSSNAASLLTYLYQAHQPSEPWDAFIQRTVSIGSDVPFFMLNQPLARVDGKGDEVQPVAYHPRNPVFQQPWLVIQPDTGMPTAEAYQQMRLHNCYRTEPLDGLIAALQTEADPSPWFLNDFELVTEKAVPALAEVRQQFLALGVLRPILCGSGSAMAGLMPVGSRKTDVDRLLPMPDGWQWWWLDPQAA